MSMRGHRQLPKGWVKKQLKDVCTKVEYGTSAKSQPEGKVPVLRMGNIQDGGIDWENLAYTSDQEEIDKYLLKYNDVLFNRTNSAEHVGKAAIYKGEMPAIFAGYLIRIHRKEELIDADFLNYYLNSDAAREYGRSVMSQSVNQANINGTKLKEYPIPVPPIAQQKQIVAILDEAFEGIDSAIANTEKNLANARELFESYLNAIFTRKGNNWVEKKLESVCVVERGSSPRPIKQYLTNSPDGVNWVKIGDTQGIHKYIHSTKQKITKEGAKKSRRVDPGDFILTNSMSYGKPYIMATTGYIHDGWFVLRLDKAINTEFFYYLLSSRYVQEQFQTLAAGSVVKNISSDLVKRAILPIPPLSEQELIVESVGQLVAETQRLEAIYQQKLAALNELKQSILQRAFAGELTAEVDGAAVEKVGAIAAA